MAFTTVTGSNGVTSLVGTSGIDVATIVTLASNVYVGGQAANDNVTVALATGSQVVSKYSVNGGAGNDTITLTSSVVDSVINGDGGTGASGNDTITATGTIINSAISAGSGNDSFSSALNTSNATINGNAGLDTIELGATNASFIYGGQDTDTINLQNATSSGSLINGNKGSDSITAQAALKLSGISVYGGNGNDTITFTNVTSTSSGSFFSGDLGDDIIFGTNGASGAGGNDTINGGDGSDSLTGNLGGDLLTGGAGNDVFNYTEAGQSSGTAATGTTADEITDFAATGVAATTDVIKVKAAYDSTADGEFAGAAIMTPVNTATTSSTDVATNVSNAISGKFTTANDIALVTLTAGSTGAQFAGNYVAFDVNGDANFTAGTDLVIKINTLSGLALGANGSIA